MLFVFQVLYATAGKKHLLLNHTPSFFIKRFVVARAETLKPQQIISIIPPYET
jgi:hypothetical protein